MSRLTRKYRKKKKRYQRKKRCQRKTRKTKGSGRNGFKFLKKFSPLSDYAQKKRALYAPSLGSSAITNITQELTQADSRTIKLILSCPKNTQWIPIRNNNFVNDSNFICWIPDDFSNIHFFEVDVNIPAFSKGMFGVIFNGFNSEKGNVAIKIEGIVTRKKRNKQLSNIPFKKIKKEINIAIQMDHAGIGPKVYYALVVKINANSTFNTILKLLSLGLGGIKLPVGNESGKYNMISIIIMEKLEGKTYLERCFDKEDYYALDNCKKSPFFTKKYKIYKKKCEQIKKMHKMGYIHGDLSHGKNIIVTNNNDVKIIDFGKSFVLDNKTYGNANNFQIEKGESMGQYASDKMPTMLNCS